MTHIYALCILAFAVSLDSFGVGVTYGMRRVQIPIRSIVIIALCSGLMIILAMGVGQGISFFVSPSFAEALGGIILISIGLWALYQISKTKAQQQWTEKREATKAGLRVWTFEIKKWGIVVQILRTPMVADIDRSGVISGVEAVVLGIALALDAFGAGIGASLLGLSPWVMAVLIAVMSSLFLYIGMKCGQVFSEARWMTKVIYLPGLILISFGIVKLL